MKRGEIHPPRTLFLRQNVGTLTGDDGSQFEATVNMGDLTPILKSEKTGKWFTLSWQDIVEMGIEAGIDEPDESKGGAR